MPREEITFPLYRGDFLPRGKSLDFRMYWNLALGLRSLPLPPEPPPVRIDFRIAASTIVALDACADNNILVIPSASAPDARMIRKDHPALEPLAWDPRPRFRPIPPAPAWKDL